MKNEVLTCSGEWFTFNYEPKLEVKQFFSWVAFDRELYSE